MHLSVYVCKKIVTCALACGMHLSVYVCKRIVTRTLACGMHLSVYICKKIVTHVLTLWNVLVGVHLHSKKIVTRALTLWNALVNVHLQLVIPRVVSWRKLQQLPQNLKGIGLLSSPFVQVFWSLCNRCKGSKQKLEIKDFSFEIPCGFLFVFN